MKSLRIAIFDDLPEGGAKRVVFEQIKGLSVDHQVFYFTNTIQSRFPFEHYAHDIYRYPLNLWPVHGLLRPFQEASYFFTYRSVYQQIHTKIQQLKADVLILHPSRLTQCPELTQLMQIPTIYFAEEWFRLIYEPDNYPPVTGITGFYESYRRRWLQQLDYRSVSQVDRIITTSRYNQQRLRWAYHQPSDVIPLGVDTDTFTAAAHQRRYFIFIGDKHPLNGSDLIPDDPLLPVKYITFNQNKFRYTDHELAKLYANAYATLCLGRHEPFGLTPLESMACETPVIAIAEGGYTETVINGKTGWLVSPCREAVYTAMLDAVSHPQKQNSFGSAGKSHVRSHYRWESHILELDRIIREVIHD